MKLVELLLQEQWRQVAGYAAVGTADTRTPREEGRRRKNAESAKAGKAGTAVVLMSDVPVWAFELLPQVIFLTLSPISSSFNDSASRNPFPFRLNHVGG